MISALVLLAAALSLPEEPIVFHAEPPARTAVATLVPRTVFVGVRVAPDGSVSAAKAHEPVLQFLAALAESAACKWQFSTSVEAERTYLVVFDFALTGRTDEPSHWVVTRPEPMRIRIQYFLSTVRRFARDAQGNVAEKPRCPLHRIAMDIGIAPIAYGLPRSYGSDNAADRAALREAKKVRRARKQRFPEAHPRAGGGGCVVGPEKTAEVHYCRLCREAREAWFRAHPGLEEYE